MRQLIIARKDLNISTGKLAAQVSHASMAFISHKILNAGTHKRLSFDTGEIEAYEIFMDIEPDVYEQWFSDVFTKTVCEAKNRDQLLKAAALAEELGLKENQDFFLIKDNCLTELEPEEVDEDGVGRTLTCIGFRPLPDDVVHTISKKYQLFK